MLYLLLSKSLPEIILRIVRSEVAATRSYIAKFKTLSGTSELQMGVFVFSKFKIK